MSADRVIEILAREGTLNARRLSFHFPAHVMDELSIGGALFFARLADGSASVSLDQFIDGAWLKDKAAVAAYRALSREDRLEVNALLGFVLHEPTHKVDLLISPFGIQYLALLVREYQLLQDYLPRT